MIISRILFILIFGALCGCSHWGKTPATASAASTNPTPAAKPSEPEAEIPRLEIVEAEQATLNDQDLAMGLELTGKGRASYFDGDYDAAERSLKDALLVYPFLPEARLLLAKVLLVRGAAGRDLATLKLAKLMLEMALAMQPDLLEATQLLELLSSELPSAQ